MAASDSTPYVLSIDVGTSGPKVAIVGADGSVLGSASRSVAIERHDNAAEQDAEAIWQAVVACVQQTLSVAGVQPNAVVAIAVTSQYFSLVPIDEQGLPIANLILYLDSRGAPYNHQIYERHPEAFERWADVHGMVPLPSGNDSLAHLLYVKHERPDIYERATAFVEPMDYIIARLCGDWAANPCSAFAMLLNDNRDPTQPIYADELIAMAGVDREKLPRLAPINASLGVIRNNVAEELGLTPSTKVLAGVNDTQAASIATATFLDGVGAINVGTTAQVLAHVAGKRSDFDNEIVSMPSPVAGRHLAMAENGLGAKTLDVFMRNVLFVQDALADHSAEDPFAGLEQALTETPVGADKLLYLPWLTGSGSPTGFGRARGGFLNMSLETTRAHMVRAILEGVAYNLRWLVPAVEAFAERKFEALRYSGGGAVSAGWSQVMANVMQRPVQQLADARHSNNRATALIAFQALDICGWEDVDRLCPIARTYEPAIATADVYDELFGQFQSAFEQLRPIFETLNQR